MKAVPRRLTDRLDVRHLDDQRSVGAQGRSQSRQHRGRIAGMLEDVEHRDDVVTLVIEIEVLDHSDIDR